MSPVRRALFLYCYSKSFIERAVCSSQLFKRTLDHVCHFLPGTIASLSNRFCDDIESNLETVTCPIELVGTLDHFQLGFCEARFHRSWLASITH